VPNTPIANLHAPRRFPWRALAALAGRQPIGGEREIALGCLMAARLASGAYGAGALPPAVRAERAAGARVWLASLTVPPAIRAALTRVTDASARTPTPAPELAGAIRALVASAASQLDAPSRAELERLASEVDGGS
jgi:hypothetical protein